MEEISSYQMILQKRKNLVITGRSDRDMYINARKQLGKRWVHEYLTAFRGDIILVIKKNQ